jgi:hypothetical protein
MKAWIYQDDKQVKKHGAHRASWYVGWLDPEGKRRCKSCGPGAFGKTQAERLRKKTEAELLTGTYKSDAKKTWEEFRQEYGAKILEGMRLGTRQAAEEALDHFERIIKPVRLASIRTQTIDAYRAERRTERGKYKGSLLSPASLNKELRHLRAALRKAFKWGYLPAVPDFQLSEKRESLRSTFHPTTSPSCTTVVQKQRCRTSFLTRPLTGGGPCSSPRT